MILKTALKNCDFIAYSANFELVEFFLIRYQRLKKNDQNWDKMRIEEGLYALDGCKD